MPRSSPFARAMLLLAAGVLFPACEEQEATVAARSERPEGRALIELLVSPEEPIFVDGFLGGYTPEEARLMMTGKVHPLVEKARLDLRARGEQVIPDLLGHVDDQRFSLSEVDEVWRNRTVGWVCRAMIGDQVDAIYLDHCRPDPSGWKPRYSREELEGEKMEEAFAGSKSLQDVQRAALDWIVAKEMKKGFTSKEEEAQLLGELERVGDKLNAVSLP